MMGRDAPVYYAAVVAASVDFVPMSRRWARRTAVATTHLAAAPVRGIRYVRQFSRYRYMERALGSPSALVELYPSMRDATSSTTFEPHYAIQGGWVLRGLLRDRPERHVDVGSQIPYLPFFAAVAPTTFVDIRPSGLTFPGLSEVAGSLFDLGDLFGKVPSLSCLHVVEHVGLGRYGDPLDPLGTTAACTALGEVIAPGGTLYLSLPIGRSRVCFNAHRVSRPRDVVHWVGLSLQQFDVVDDDGNLVLDAELGTFDDADYALGLFRFTA
jgi:hypothetical protein